MNKQQGLIQTPGTFWKWSFTFFPVISVLKFQVFPVKTTIFCTIFKLADQRTFAFPLKLAEHKKHAQKLNASVSEATLMRSASSGVAPVPAVAVSAISSAMVTVTPVVFTTSSVVPAVTPPLAPPPAIAPPTAT